MTRPRVEDRERVVYFPEFPLPAVRRDRLDVDDAAEPLLPFERIAVFYGFLPLSRQERPEVAHRQDDMHLSQEQRPHDAIGLIGLTCREELVRYDRRLGCPACLTGEELPFADPR